ncbi:hypothetical protein JKF63_01119 [Porcisia hertigi]|uniref:Uncharacterized protein n=1 Tax=Porcisia hertigi TaxID=2761500 RepID=A0A836HFW9_9TRYP|nr:hypothetical protein JKF63_01119 [Porcisia hertigi]
MQELARQFEQQGIRCSEDAPQQLLCLFCTNYQQDLVASKVSHDNLEVGEGGELEGRDVAVDNENSRADSDFGSSSTSLDATRACYSNTPPPPLCILEATREAVLAHCATRTHLYLYEYHAQNGLQHWCAVDLHGYRMLLNHHCIYPSRMFGNGRMLMDTSISGGMLLGVDVCGGVKLWPQHQYIAVELILPSASSGVREVLVPPLSTTTTTVEESQREGGEGGEQDVSSPQLSKSTPGSRVAWIIHESSEISEEVASSYASNLSGSRQRGANAMRSLDRFPASKHSSRVSSSIVPRYFDELHRVRSQRVMQGSLRIVLEATNASIIGECRLRRQRRRHLVKHGPLMLGREKM